MMAVGVGGFYRTEEERASHEAFWEGYADGVDHATEHMVKLHAPRCIRRHYLAGYQNGFYDRKKRETRSHEDLALSVFRASPRADIERAGLPWWANYTREGKR